MNRESFLKLLRELLFPVLREDGFKGSGTTLRRIVEPVIHLVNIQGSTSSDGFYMNLGAHLDFLPTEGGGNCDPKKLKEYHCAFRSRIDPPKDVPLRGRWPYGQNEAQARSMIELLLAAWSNQGVGYFTSLSDYPADFLKIVEETLSDPPHSRDALTIARIALRLEMRGEAAEIATRALEATPPMASTLRAWLTEFLKECRD